MSRLLEWLKIQSQKKMIFPLLSLFSFTESIIFPIPIDIFVILLASFNPKKWFKIFLNSTFFSVLGALFAYALGYFFFDTVGVSIIEFLSFQDHFLEVQGLFEKGVFVVMFLSAFTPIPYKVFTLAGGFLKVSLLPFVLASVLGRGLRFFLEAFFAQKYGEIIARKFLKYFNIFGLVLVVAIVFYVLF